MKIAPACVPRRIAVPPSGSWERDRGRGASEKREVFLDEEG
jgi:hypothetical protein